MPTTQLTVEQITALTAQLADAKAAYHRLLTGAATRVIVDQNGERVEFVAARKADLYQYIQSLEALLAPPEQYVNRGPLRFLF